MKEARRENGEGKKMGEEEEMKERVGALESLCIFHMLSLWKESHFTGHGCTYYIIYLLSCLKAGKSSLGLLYIA